MHHSNLPLLIVGAGPTGLAMAAWCRQYQLSFRFIDKNDGPSVYSKALVMHTRTQEVLSSLHLTKPALDTGEALRTLHVYSDDRMMATICPEEVPSPYPRPLILEQSQTEHLLVDVLRSNNVVVERLTQLVTLKQYPTHVRVGLKKPDGAIETADFSWVMGCDGSHSTVRELSNIPFDGKSYEETFFLADVKIDWSKTHQDGGFLFLKSGCVAAIVPFKNGWVRVIGILPDAWITSEMRRQKTISLDQLQHILAPIIPETFRLYDPKWVAVFYSQRKLAKQFQKDRVFLLGDAAHVHSPAGGQGMNTGIQDAYNLAWKMRMVIENDASCELLRSYDLERRQVAAKVLKYTDFAFKGATLKSPVLKSIRKFIFPKLLSFPVIRKRVQEGLSQIRVGYPRSPLNLQSKVQGPKPGERFPHFKLDGGKSSLDVLVSGDHTLVICKIQIDDKTADQISQCQRWLGRYPMSRLVILCQQWNAKLPIGAPVYNGYSNSMEGAFWVRPDGYVIGSVKLSAASINNMIDRYFFQIGTLARKD